MSTYRLFTLFIAITLVVTVGFAAQRAFSNGNSTYSESKSQALREYSLGERYGVSNSSAVFSPGQIHRESILGEQYGVTPQEYAHQQAMHEYWLGERYGQTP